ncbi:MAG: hypothetical protein HQK49_15485 [Oligoflexia bacterium]|nr:hypothetical protein [Oligoflexia bacterium]
MKKKLSKMIEKNIILSSFVLLLFLTNIMGANHALASGKTVFTQEMNDEIIAEVEKIAKSKGVLISESDKKAVLNIRNKLFSAVSRADYKEIENLLSDENLNKLKIADYKSVFYKARSNKGLLLSVAYNKWANHSMTYGYSGIAFLPYYFSDIRVAVISSLISVGFDLQKDMYTSDYEALLYNSNSILQSTITYIHFESTKKKALDFLKKGGDRLFDSAVEGGHSYLVNHIIEKLGREKIKEAISERESFVETNTTDYFNGFKTCDPLKRVIAKDWKDSKMLKILLDKVYNVNLSQEIDKYIESAVKGGYYNSAEVLKKYKQNELNKVSESKKIEEKQTKWPEIHSDLQELAEAVEKYLRNKNEIDTSECVNNKERANTLYKLAKMDYLKFLTEESKLFNGKKENIDFDEKNASKVIEEIKSKNMYDVLANECDNFNEVLISYLGRVDNSIKRYEKYQQLLNKCSLSSSSETLNTIRKKIAPFMSQHLEEIKANVGEIDELNKIADKKNNNNKQQSILPSTNPEIEINVPENNN